MDNVDPVVDEVWNAIGQFVKNVRAELLQDPRN